MKQNHWNALIGLFLFIGLSAILKFYFKSSNALILFTAVMGLLAGLTRIIVFGYSNPPVWLYRIRHFFLGIFSGTFIGIVLFGMDSIEENTFIIHDLLKYIIVGIAIGGLFTSSMLINKFIRLKSQKGILQAKRTLLKDFAQLTSHNGKSVYGQLILTNDHLTFIAKKETFLEKDIRAISPDINKMKFTAVPNGFRIEEDNILLKVPFPYYWLKIIDKRQKLICLHGG
ncbi:hypothetical protein [Carboxylicivirga sp. RSCT41]|uniref:hypothetical protein n=1 Tax=Carboxylicivirga agarovorans TaxID=3417570 RepID=UPI003D33B5D9